MKKEIDCFINTPTKSYQMKRGEMVLLPAAEGEMGVLFGHANMIVDLKSGDVRILQSGVLQDNLQLLDKSSIAHIKSDRIEIFCYNFEPSAKS